MLVLTHRVIEERSLALHREIARRMLADHEILDRARDRVRIWLEEGNDARPWLEQWEEILDGTPEEVAAVVVDPSQRGRDLRQSSPFAGALDPKTRWRILREFRASLEAQ
jgi:hypothetical protein